jgi:glucosyl-dolichyl phosphate glucuronosyltransferase
VRRDQESARSTLPVSVVICAYTEKRWDDVLAAVDSVRAQELPPHEIIVVVDHNPVLLSRLRTAVADALVIENRFQRGLSGGKNTGIEVATGVVVAFLDDDAVAEPGWLRHLVAGYTQPDVIGVGGLTLPLWETCRPAWFPEEFDWTVGCTFVGREPGRVRNLLGGNASFLREVFALAGGFPEDIGRSAAHRRPLGCEETEFCIRLAQRCPGTSFLFEAGAVIHHRVPMQRCGFRYFRTRCYAEGLSKAQVTRSVGVADGLASERRYAAVTLRRGAARGLLEAVHGDFNGLARSAAIATGLLCTTAGFAVGRLQGGHHTAAGSLA